ncbi:hypothetical protein IMCC3317_47410 [Kordia antarctica]|uniref:Uncharacterized protein n=1 Tax=Kordia antarctica TaxID=1218801 RepID=A0A7L4ZS69_9FLAO|nr:hypothetical protein [Kordia antarctica]QHI39331.1 hypothetical protein IMCC3317_47410 [Kordia antarctica]
MTKLEKTVGIIISMLMLSMLVIAIPFSNMLLTLSVLVLFLVYFFLGFWLFNNIPLTKIGNKEARSGISTMRIIGSICAGFALATTVIGILFVFMRWPYGHDNLSNGLKMLGVVLLISTIKIGITKAESSFYKRMILRVCIVGIVGLSLKMIPTVTLFEMKCHNCPEAYMEAEKALINDPDNLELQRKADEERRKMFEEE